MAATTIRLEEEYGRGQPQLEKFRIDWSMVREEASAPPPGEVLFADKTAPVDQRPLRELSGGAEPFCFSRGTVDVSGLRDLLDGDENVWGDAYAAAENVRLDRPSHDSWGIRKLAFVFCDDFLHRVYRLPLWDRPEWRVHLDPIFAACGVPRDRVVRGYWVPRTHRLHVAIKTWDDVVFKVGRTKKTLRRFRYAEGDVVELNNQAKHYVANLADHYRTHLIFDYVDDEAEPELLPPRMPCKAGTTSMYEYLSQHPLVARGVRRETHFLDWRWRDDLDGDGAAASRHWHEAFFDAAAHADHPSLVALDSTPSYLLQSNLAIPRLRRLRAAAPPMIVMVRDPAARAASHFAMITDPRATPAQRRSRGSAWLGKSMREVLQGELELLARHRVLRRAPGAAGAVSLAEPLALDRGAFRAFLPRIPNGHGAHSLLLRGCYAAQLLEWYDAFGRDPFLVVRCEDMAAPDGARTAVAAAMAHAGLRFHPIDDAAPKNARDYEDQDPALLADLRAFAPLNAMRTSSRSFSSWRSRIWRWMLANRFALLAPV
ncbi:N-acetylgalactosamine 4-sulfate 6-O-sulfotransferase [Aureococcus anophagefferens]|nr:N-acetylgalactosamine 4-sulfate 6-O-sulfotransferase [Aureococcus anophagefferens]